jgi:hypothetical protein
MVQESVAVAKRFFKSISIPFFDFLETTNFEETHDIADAALFTLMALEETTWYSTLVLRLRFFEDEVLHMLNVTNE